MSEIEVLKYFKYDKKTGSLIWKDHWRQGTKTVIKGKIAGTIDHCGYRIVCVKYKKYLVHRLIWFLENGVFPACIDHINGKRTDNRISNLRDVTQRQNTQNSYKHRRGKLVGCSFFKRDQNWMAQIVIKNKKKYLGMFSTEIDAHKAYLRALKEYNLC